MPVTERWYTHPKGCKCEECEYHRNLPKIRKKQKKETEKKTREFMKLINKLKKEEKGG
ncbi:hypothetical protein ACFLVX_01935 [Chloroflexota bacterium]